MSITITGVENIPLIKPMEGGSADLAHLIGDAMEAMALVPRDGDILVLAQKIVSKAEGRQVALDTVTPSDEAITLAGEVDKDPRIVELILSEATRIVRKIPGVLIVEHRLGFVHANAGIDQSNVEGEDQALLLPVDSDASASLIRTALETRFGVSLGIVIADSMGRAWRKGTVGFSIGNAGTDGLLDLKGTQDFTGRVLEITEVGRADELAAAAGLIMGQSDEGQPVALVRGVKTLAPQDGIAPLLRAPNEDLFR
jgi:coenzyme F420-0:L-glutamate ligase/coenzyme F420-1:gamma-L-glutamate ligase